MDGWVGGWMDGWVDQYIRWITLQTVISPTTRRQSLHKCGTQMVLLDILGIRPETTGLPFRVYNVRTLNV